MKTVPAPPSPAPRTATATGRASVGRVIATLDGPARSASVMRPSPPAPLGRVGSSARARLQGPATVVPATATLDWVARLATAPRFRARPTRLGLSARLTGVARAGRVSARLPGRAQTARVTLPWLVPGTVLTRRGRASVASASARLCLRDRTARAPSSRATPTVVVHRRVAVCVASASVSTGLGPSLGVLLARPGTTRIALSSASRRGATVCVTCVCARLGGLVRRATVQLFLA